MPQSPIAPLWEQGRDLPRPSRGPMDVFLPRDNVVPFGIDKATGAQQTLLDDGSMVIDFEPWRERQKPQRNWVWICSVLVLSYTAQLILQTNGLR